MGAPATARAGANDGMSRTRIWIEGLILRVTKFSVAFVMVSAGALSQSAPPPEMQLGSVIAPESSAVDTRNVDTRNVAGAQARPPIRRFLDDVVLDQKSILTSPRRVKKTDMAWLLPLAGGTAFLLATDERNMTERLHTNTLAESRSAGISNLGLASLALIPSAVYWWGWRHGDTYYANSAVLTVRAVTDSLIVAEGIQLIARRERPNPGNESGAFFQMPSSSSFPSLHAAAAWSTAAVLTQRYPNWLAQIGLYGLASVVSVSRVPAQAHFPSDVVVGSALGFLVGKYVARTDGQNRAYWFEEHEPKTSLAAPPVRKASSAPADGGETNESGGSASVPMDSWVYDALDRLAAFGLIPSQTSGLRPWARTECRRQVREADAQIKIQMDSQTSAVLNEAQKYIAALHREFDELDTGRGAVVLDSLYVRDGFIAGPLLNDSYHFGQTWSNDFGRPYGRGLNSIEGFQSHAQSGHFFAYIDGEYQHAPGEPAYSLPVRETIAGLDGNPLRAPDATGTTNRFRTIEAYVGARLGDFEFSVGKQSLYWGPTDDAPLFFSDNAEPAKNAKISTVSPIRLPGILRYLGEIRGEMVIGKLGGQAYTWRPWFNAQKISFKLTDDLEMGFTRWSQFGGVGNPITADLFWRNLTTTSSQAGKPGNYPGEVKGGFDFKYRIPGLRNWLTLYSDSYSDDDPSPLASPRRAGVSPGLYLSHVPGFARWEFRVEAASTTPMEGDQGPGFIYWNGTYHDSNTNYGYLLGNSVGRDGRAMEGWSTYWFTPRSKLQAGYRQRNIGSQFLAGGGTQTDASLKGSLELPHQFFASAMFQYERYLIPVLGGPARNLSGWLQLSWDPKLKLAH